ncbi:hybrid sensor histidine kinase/response regulator [Desulfobulbus alkaliphilus]|uniref:hybrid sensor histidine kinase/response regulator n=1 Tax=Desulfobulbus alkaliphilus TaxID=869814 RepID=UPI001965EF74|nr:ATP-binding protein [Desulfobulbus alkaliphilus]MBM9537065.1 response regulator [Desulfobulbus alkaliphilus]
MMQKTLRLKINIAILITGVVLVLVLGSLLYFFEENRRNARYEDIHVLVDTLYQQNRNELANEIFAGQQLALAHTLAAMEQVRGVARVVAYTLQGEPVLPVAGAGEQFLAQDLRAEVEYGPVLRQSRSDGQNYLDYLALIQVIGEKIGYLHIRYDLKALEREVFATRFFFVGLFICMLGTMLFLLNVQLYRSVIRPASLLRAAIHQVRQGHFGERVDLTTSDEIGQIAAAFNDMSMRLREQHIALNEAIEAKEAYASSLAESNRSLERLNARLEDMVEARTADLRASNEQLRREIYERQEMAKHKQQLEEKLAQSRKMEALGLLAGGVAHDLNNVLSGIVSYPDLLLLQLPKESPYRKSLVTIRDSGQRAAAIVQDLLAMARRGVTSMEVLNLNQLVRDYLASPEHEQLRQQYTNTVMDSDLDPELLDVKGSAAHLRKALMNLVSNAVESQPDGGRVLIRTSNRYLDRPVSGYEQVAPGEYVVLEVRDQGPGISAADLKRIFEPFYTKKVMGRSGTGLGMTVVWGIVQDHQGSIDIHSVVGGGTAMELYLPITRDEPVQGDGPQPIALYQGNQERVLVVDDVREQREIATGMLEHLGYQVASVASGEEAVAWLRERSVDVLVLDMIMDPGMDGLDTYKEVCALHPGQKAVIASGFAENERVEEALRSGVGAYVRKPYTLESLGMALHKVLQS